MEGLAKSDLADYIDMLHSILVFPGPQNSHQGWVLGKYQKQLKAQGMTFNRGDKFVISISINYDTVLGQNLREDGSIDCEDDKRSTGLERRDGDTITLSGNESEWDDLVTSARNLTGCSSRGSELVTQADPTLKYVLLPLGDLSTGTYSARVQVVSGSTLGGYVIIDNEGGNYTTNDASLSTGQTQDYDFTLEDEAPGFAVMITTRDNDTTISWKLDGTISTVTASSSSTGSPSPTGSRGAQEIDITFEVMGMMIATCLLVFILQ